MNNLDIIKSLAKGNNPITGELISDDNILSDPVIIRALFAASEAMSPGNQIPSSNLISEKMSKEEQNIQEGRPKNHGLPWASELKEELINNFKNGSSIEELTSYFERTTGSINGVLFKEGLIDQDELPKALSIEEKIAKNIELGRPQNAGIPWDKNDINELINSFKNGSSIEQLSKLFNRTDRGIENALADAGLKSEVQYQKRKLKNADSNLPLNHGSKWTELLKEELFDKYSAGITIPELALQFERTQGSIAGTLHDAGMISEEQFESVVGRAKPSNFNKDYHNSTKPNMYNKTSSENNNKSENQEADLDPNFPFKL